MRFARTPALLLLLVVVFCMPVRGEESEQKWGRSAPPLAESSRYSQRYNEPKPLPGGAVTGVAKTEPRSDSREFDQRLTALELALSTIISEKPNLWRFDTLEAEASSLLMAAPGEKERQVVREVATRIDSFAAIAGRYRETRGSFAELDRAKIAPPTQLTKAQEPQQTKSEADKLGYDAVGVLRSVVSQRAEAPKFALVDGKGKVTTFLTPTPDLNLQSLIGKRIGVKGSRGFMPAYKREHLTANRVTALETVRR